MERWERGFKIAAAEPMRFRQRRLIRKFARPLDKDRG